MNDPPFLEAPGPYPISYIMMAYIPQCIFLSLNLSCVCVCVAGRRGGGGAGPCKDKIQFYFLLSICLRSVSFLVRPARRTERDRRKNFALLTAHYLIFLSLNFSFSKMVSLTTSKISWTTRGNRYKAPNQ